MESRRSCLREALLLALTHDGKVVLSKAAKIPEPNSGMGVWLWCITTGFWVEQGTRENQIFQTLWFNFLWLSLSGSAGGGVPLHFLAGASWRMRLRTRRLSGFWRHHCWILPAPQSPAEAAVRWLQFQHHLWKRSRASALRHGSNNEEFLCTKWIENTQTNPTTHRFYHSLKGKKNIFNQYHKIYINNKSSRAPGNFHMSKLPLVQKGLHPVLEFNGSAGMWKLLFGGLIIKVKLNFTYWSNELPPSADSSWGFLAGECWRGFCGSA